MPRVQLKEYQFEIFFTDVLDTSDTIQIPRWAVDCIRKNPLINHETFALVKDMTGFVHVLNRAEFEKKYEILPEQGKVKYP